MFLLFNISNAGQFFRQHERSELTEAITLDLLVLSKLKFNCPCGERAARCLLRLGLTIFLGAGCIKNGAENTLTRWNIYKGRQTGKGRVFLPCHTPQL